jgi:hypothetical protein
MQRPYSREWYWSMITKWRIEKGKAVANFQGDGN